MKKLFSLGLALSILVTPLQALDISAYGDVDTIMEDNALSDVATRYSAVQLSFFPEYATRLGFNTAEDRLDRRDNERDAQALRALKLVQEGLNKINRKQLSEPKRTEYDMLQNMIEYDLYNLNRNRNMQDPLLYSSVFDALYDLRMKQINYTDVQKRDLAARLAMLPDVAHQAQNNLSTPPSFLSQIAMEKAYYAYLSFDEMEQYLVAQVSDDTAKAQLKRLTKESKTAIKDLFDLFKKTAQENTDKDFRLGSKKYETILKNRYSINQSESAMSKYLQKNLRAAQQELLYAINRFPVVEETVVVTEESTPAATTATEEVEVVSAPEEMVSGETAQNAETAAAENTSQKQAEPEKQAAKPQPKKPSAKKVKKPTTATAIDFYPIADRVTANVPQQQQNFISAFSTEATKLNQMFTREDILPMASASFKIRQMPAYYAYFKAYMFLPPFGTQTNPSHDLFLRLPAGSEETKAAMIAQDFNIPTLKLLMAGQLVPGLAYRSAYRDSYLSAFRKMYSVPTMRNGWEVYAQHLAQERRYIASDEELLFLAWADYVRAVQAVVDFNLNTQRFTYSDALEFLTDTQGFVQPQAEQMLKQVTENPGEAVSYIYGYDAIKNLRAKYQKKLGKNFSLKDFHTKLMSVGDIPLDRLEPEINYAYEVEKNRISQAMATPFYR